MNGLSHKQMGLGGVGAIVVGIGLVLVPGGGSSASHAATASPVGTVVSAMSPATPGTATPDPSAATTPESAASSTPAAAATTQTSASSAAPPPASAPAATTGAPPLPTSAAAPPPKTTPSSKAPPASAKGPSSSILQPVDPLPISVGPTVTQSIPPSSNCGKSTGWSGAAFSPIAGTDHDTCHNMTAETTADDAARGGTQDLGKLADGSWGRYMMVDFGTGATQFYGRVASGAPAGISGKVQVHLDKLDGPVVSVFEIANTGGWQTWRTIAMNMNPTSGVHDVYLTFDSGQPQPFVSLHWFDFGN